MLRKIGGPSVSTGLRPGLWKWFVASCHGQDLIEYTLLLAFVCLVSAALFIGAGGALGGVWSAASSHINKGHHYAKGQDK